MSNNRNTKRLHGKMTGMRKRSAYRQDNDEISSEPGSRLRKRVNTADEMPSEPGRKSQTADVSSSRRRVVARSPLRGSAAGEQTIEITDSRGHQLEPAGHADDELHSVDEDEQVAEHSSQDNVNDGDSVRCFICLVPFTTQDIATPDTCDDTLCAACLQELSHNGNNCPFENNMFNVILVRHYLGREIIRRIPVEPPNLQKRPQS
jgi:PHD and RING finger domain-containing protein 1